MVNKKISSKELSSRYNEVINLIKSNNEPIIITNSIGESEAVLISPKTYDTLTHQFSILADQMNTDKEKTDGKITFQDYIDFFSQIINRLNSLEEAYTQILVTTAHAMETNQSYVYGHNERVAILACQLAQQMGCSEEEVNHLRYAAMLHDVGEIVIPTFILQKSSNLSQEDWELIREHPRISAEMVGKVKKLEPVTTIIYSHHEKFDGSGYPKGLKGSEIPLGSRILSIVDAYDAMTNVRLHRESENHLIAIEEIKKLSGTHYDPKIVETFINMF